MKNLKKIRKEKKLTQEELAKKIGVSKASFSRYESGEANVSVGKIIELCKILDVSSDELLGISERNENEVNEFVLKECDPVVSINGELYNKSDILKVAKILKDLGK